MAITAISTDWGVSPRIVRITTTDDLAAITTADYVTAQLDNILALNNGAFEFQSGDFIAIVYDGGQAFFTYDSATDTFVAEAAVPGTLPNTLTSAHIFVGNAGNVATDVAMTGDIAITNAGVTSIVAGAIVNADINAAADIAFSKLAALPSAEILVGSAGNVATAVAMTGDVAISNVGATTIQAGAIDLAMLSVGITPSDLIKFSDQYTTLGGAAAEAIAVAGALNTDLAFVQLVSPGTNTVSVDYAVVTADTLTVTFSADPGNDAIINYQIIRAAA